MRKHSQVSVLLGPVGHGGHGIEVAGAVSSARISCRVRLLATFLGFFGNSSKVPLTSFKTAQLASRLSYIDKVLFVVDRKDLDIENRRFFIRTPKGKGRYQDPHPVKLLFPFMDDRLNEFLTARRKYLDRQGVDSPYLFPNVHSPDGTYSDKTRGTYIRDLSEKCGIPFSLRQFRSSVSALIVDQDPDKLKSYMSAQIGHQKAATFELFYWRIKMGAVDSKLDEAGKSVSLPDMHRRAEEITGRRRGRPKKN